VLSDCLDELISVEQARDVYGVVIEAGALDDAATDELRVRMRDGGSKGEGG
jgi:hypothetical protein